MTRLIDMNSGEQAAFQRRFKAAFRDYGTKSDERYVDGFTVMGIHPLSWQPLKLAPSSSRCFDCAHHEKHKDGGKMKQRCALQSMAKRQKELPFAGAPFNSLWGCEEYKGD